MSSSARWRRSSSRCTDGSRSPGGRRSATLQAGRTDLTQDGAFIDNTLNAYTQGNTAVFACPSDGGEASRSGTSYYWNVALNGQPLSGLNFFNHHELTWIVVLADKAAYHPYLANKVNLLYADGHADKDTPTFGTNP